MSLQRNIVILVVTLIFVCTSGYAQERLTLTLENSVKLALEKNPEIKMAEKEVAKAKAAVWEAYSNILPQLKATANFQHAWDLQTTTIPNFLKPMLSPLAPFIPEFDKMPDYVQLVFGLENTFFYGATLTQPLFLGGAGVSGIKMAYAGSRAAENSLNAKKQDLIYKTANAFYACLLAKELVNVQEEALQQTEANFNVVLKKYKVGMASGFDKMRAQVEVANRKPQVIAARNNYKLALTNLRTILGLERNVDIKVEGEFQYVEDELDRVSLKDIQSQALLTRPEIQALNEQKYISKKSIDIAKSSFMPKLFFQTDYSFLAMRNDYKFQQDDFSKGFTSAISLQIPLFTGFKNSKQYQKAKLEYRIMLDTEKKVFDGIAAEVEVTYNAFQEAKEKYQAASQSVDLATEALRLANLMYDEGTNTQLDVLNSQLALTQARLNFVSSIYEYQIARYKLRKATGILTGII